MKLFSRLTHGFAFTIGLTATSAVVLVALSAGGARLSAQGATAAYPAVAAAADTRTAIRPFRVNISDADLGDLRHRLLATRWPDKETVGDRSQGVQLEKLQALVRYWGTGYDWRKVEARLNALPQFITNIDGVDIHFIHVRSRHPHALPLIVTHGWPGSIIEQLKIVGPLTDPTAYGGRAEDAFDVVIPSLPGYGFSGKPTGTGWDPDHIARAWGELMKRLGYTHYVAQAGLTDKERAVFDVLVASAKMGSSAYFTMLTARPQTVGYGVTDSPAGLAAWVLVHAGFSQWNYGDDPRQTLTKDDVLDDITLYWLTNSATSAGRLYWENGGKSPLVAAAWKTTDIKMPVAITVFGEDAYLPPETWARRAYPSLIYFHEVPKGGHFAAWEQPELFAAELRAAFRTLRDAQ